MATCNFRASEFDRDALEGLIGALSAYGLEVSCSFSASGRTASVEVGGIPTPEEARRTMTRGAGRHRAWIALPGSSVFDSGTTCEEFLAWMADGHTAAEAAEQLGLSRSTFFRRLPRIRELVAQERRRNAAFPDREPIHHLLVNVH